MPSTALWQDSRQHLPAAPATSAVLLLHGYGSNADDLIDLAPILAETLPHTAFYSPNAPEPCEMGPYGRQWFSLMNRTPAEYLAGVQRAAPSLQQMITDVSDELKLPLSKIALVGFSQGSMMSLYVAPRLPYALGAVVGLSGALVGPELLTAEVRSKPPILLAHGQMDPVVPYAALPMAEASLKLAGLAVETITRPMMAHNIDEEVLTGSARFLKEKLG
jgi:phospholipase/carboxylesterase